MAHREFLTWLFNSKPMILLGPLLSTHSLGGFPFSQNTLKRWSSSLATKSYSLAIGFSSVMKKYP
jgi:hypothetical protein